MRVGKKVLLVTGFAALGLFTFGASSAIATELHPHHDGTTEALHTECVWSVDKTASVTSLTLSLGQVSPSVTYTITVNATCQDQHHNANGDHHVVPNSETFHPLHELHPLPDHVVNECVVLDDSYTGTGSPQDVEVCLDDLDASGNAVFHYTRTFGPFSECGTFDVTNIATITSQAVTGGFHPQPAVVLDHDEGLVHINIPCVSGCTLTQGYWKTHSEFCPAPYDNTWALLPNGASTLAFLPYVDADGNPGTWYSIFWTAPAGNVYYQLAHQYMAARLNILNGASSTTAVNTALAGAEAFFAQYTPAEAAALAKTSTARQNALAWASTLGSYNEGTLAGGPPHCDE